MSNLNKLNVGVSLQVKCVDDCDWRLLSGGIMVRATSDARLHFVCDGEVNLTALDLNTCRRFALTAVNDGKLQYQELKHPTNTWEYVAAVIIRGHEILVTKQRTGYFTVKVYAKLK